MAKNNATHLIEQLLRTIDDTGLNETIDTLKRKQASILSNTPDLQIHIIETTCNDFEINEQTLCSGRDKSAKRYNALGVCALMLKSHLGISQTQIAYLLRKDVSTISRHLKRLQNLNINYKQDKELADKICEIEKNSP